MKSAQVEKLLLFVLSCTGIVLLAHTNLFAEQLNQHFVHLANSFIHGKLSFLPGVRISHDTVNFLGQSYWPLGPMPAVLLMPFVALWDTAILLGYVQYVLVALCFYLLYKIAIKILDDRNSAIWLSFGYIFSTAFIGVAFVPWSWQYAQVVATMFTLAAIYEYFYKKRWLLIGINLAAAIATRLDLILALVFFIGTIFVAHSNKKVKLRSLFMLGSPIVVSIVLLLTYNYFRFQNPFDQGYTMQMLTTPELIVNRHAGLWSFTHFPANLYYFLLKSPDAVLLPGSQILTYPFLREHPWGMSIFFTSPLFLWIIKAPFRKKEVILASLTALFIAFVLFGYYGIGYTQFGYRYALDFYPFLFIILLFALNHHVPKLLKFVIVFSFLFNSYLVFTV